MNTYKKPSGAVNKLARFLKQRTLDKNAPITNDELEYLAKKHPLVFQRAQELAIKRIEKQNKRLEGKNEKNNANHVTS